MANAQVIDTRAGSVEVEDVGTGAAVLSVHGTPGGSGQAMGFAAHFRDAGLRVIAPSRPGYGQTPLDSGETFEQQADLLAALLDALEVEHVAVYAISGGGPAALQLAIRHPLRVTAMVLEDTWYAHWRSNSRQVKRKIGPKRAPGSREGLTRAQAEAQLRRLIDETQAKPPSGERLTVDEVASRYVAHAERQGRKPSTCANIESETRVHLEPFFRGRSLEAIQPEDVLDLVGTLEAKGLAVKTIRNVVATLSALFNFAHAPRRRWVSGNPCAGLDLPAVPEQTEIRFLTLEEVDALVAAARPGMFQGLDRALFLTAAMTGLRKGELVALRWRDVDWTAGRIRVRQNYVRGEFGTPKSKRSTRSVPMADAVGGELERLFQASRWQGDGDLAFAHPATGEPLPKANVTRRFRAALREAGLDDSHVFHDLRHTFGTRMAAAGVPMRTLQEWLGHRDLATTQIYADYAPSAHEAEMVAAAFARGSNPGSNLSESQAT